MFCEATVLGWAMMLLKNFVMNETQLKLQVVIIRFNRKIKANLFGFLVQADVENPQQANLWEKRLDMFITKLIVHCIA